MNRCLVKLSLVSCGVLLALGVAAQTPQPSTAKAPSKANSTKNPAASKPAAPKTQADDAKTQTAAVTAKATQAATATTTVAVAGSVIILADGIVANAAIAQIQPPADGFEYER